MVEYIERETMRQVLRKASISERFVDELPTADVEPVLHGRWVNENFPEKLATVHDLAQCSVCGKLSHKAEHGYAILSKFCPNCGAKMDKEDHDGH